jgi:hypothetical protein
MEPLSYVENIEPLSCDENGEPLSYEVYDPELEFKKSIDSLIGSVDTLCDCILDIDNQLSSTNSAIEHLTYVIKGYEP